MALLETKARWFTCVYENESANLFASWLTRKQMIGLYCSESICRRESWEGYTDCHIIFFKENNCLLKRICNANTAAGKRGDLSRSPNDPLGFPYELVGFIQGVFCDCRPPRSSKCQPVRKFWHLELFWWDLLWNLTLRTFRGAAVTKDTL